MRYFAFGEPSAVRQTASTDQVTNSRPSPLVWPVIILASGRAITSNKAQRA
ncbi:hypothetical protein [Sphingomonas mucosissima]|uniref:Uncharacterized protein n=1 Tax=Sphingomonas mucosissima TaxID=370959 RepID=A0A245ZJL7_9SPHN|nr:hypothetical protein [Sphingomonas mucosissima]OWK29916.1 hypothetical protein SPMU_23380 [Sphingomonas mucosissima]